MIKINDLAYSYGSNPVLENITMTFEEGKTYGLLGENGVGKTTLLTLLCGLKKPRAGSIHTDGNSPYSRQPSLLGNQYYIPENVEALNAVAASWAAETGLFWPRYSHNLFLRIMREFDTDASMKMNRMSAGQLKKTHIAFALACNVKYLFMDEPTNGLDIPSKTGFRSAILKYTAEDSTVVISTHQVRDLENIIDPIVILDRRDVLLNASLEEITRHLYFDYGNSLRMDALYSEQTPSGFIQVCPNEDGLESKVDMEALFNAVYRHRDIIKPLFNK